jgi:4,5-dihydroxyphthalate decarboxylase
MVAAQSFRIALSIALSDNPLTQPLLNGSVSPQAVELLPTSVHPSEIFWRQLHYGDFDVSEMSLSSLMIAVERGDDRWIALPVYTMRRFFHTGVLIRRGSRIEQPADLAGKRVGVPEYQQTSAIWTRGILEEQFGLDLRSVEWFMERGPDRSHGAATGFLPPAGIRLNQIRATSSIGSMLVSGELDATLLYLRESNLVDRSHQDVEAVTEPLFKDPLAEGQRYHRQCGLYPMNHAVVVRRELLSRNPWLALNLYHAFISAKEAARRAAAAIWRPCMELGRINRATADLLEEDPLPFGIAAARGELETISRYVHRQGLTSRQIRVEELFAPSTLRL